MCGRLHCWDFIPLLLVDYPFLSNRSLRNVLLLSMTIPWLIMSKMTWLSGYYCICVCLTLGANYPAFMCVAPDLGNAPQTGLCAWLNLRWQVKPLLHEGFSVCSYCVMTTFQPLWVTVWHSSVCVGNPSLNLIQAKFKLTDATPVRHILAVNLPWCWPIFILFRPSVMIVYQILQYKGNTPSVQQ